MSENEDERLDRAKRIRKMREGGGRGDGADDAGDEPSGGADDDNTGENGNDGNGGESTDDGPASGGAADDGADEVESEADVSDGKVPEVNVPEVADLSPESAPAPSLEAEDDLSAPLPDSEELEEALDSAGAEAETAAPEEGGSGTATPGETPDSEGGHEEETRVLEFRLGEEYYCLDIGFIEEIVKDETVTRVPNTPEYVEGVVDLRGQITTVLNPKVTIGKDDVSPGELIVVFDPDSFDDQGRVGWLVDDVRQVSPITDGDVNEPPVEEEYINGVIDREDDDLFVIWTDPDMAMEEME